MFRRHLIRKSVYTLVRNASEVRPPHMSLCILLDRFTGDALISTVRFHQMCAVSEKEGGEEMHFDDEQAGSR